MSFYIPHTSMLSLIIDPVVVIPFRVAMTFPTDQMPESAFSIQLVPPLVIVSLARVLGLSASSAFILLIGATGFLTSVALCWFLFDITRDNRIAAVGSLFILVFAGAAAGQGLLGLLLHLDVFTLGLPFLRRYQPAAAFFSVFCFLCDGLPRAPGAES
jgi:hypothetical protein